MKLVYDRNGQTCPLCDCALAARGFHHHMRYHERQGEAVVRRVEGWCTAGRNQSQVVECVGWQYESTPKGDLLIAVHTTRLNAREAAREWRDIRRSRFASEETRAAARQYLEERVAAYLAARRAWQTVLTS